MHHIDDEGFVELIIQGEGIAPEELNIPENALSTISNTLSENRKNQLVITLIFSELKTANSFRRKIEHQKTTGKDLLKYASEGVLFQRIYVNS